MRLRLAGVETKLSLWFLPVIPAVIAAGYLSFYVIAYFSIILHEFSHAAVALYFGSKILAIEASPLGLRLIINDSNLVRKELLFLYAAGPAANLFILAMSWLFIFISGAGETYPSNIHSQLISIMIINLCLAALNLLPAVPFDGGRIVQVILSARFGARLAKRYMRILLGAVSVFLIACGSYTAAVSKFNPSLLFAGAYLLAEFLFRGGNMELMNIKQLHFRKSRLLKKGVYPARDIVAVKTTCLGDIMKSMDYDMFHLIYIIDERMEIVGVLTENHIIDGITKLGIEATVYDLYKKLESKETF